jgi:hypothetical protein
VDAAGQFLVDLKDLPDLAVLPVSNRQDLWMEIFRRLLVGDVRRVVRRACR